jgi:hypothetical protein
MSCPKSVSVAAPAAVMRYLGALTPALLGCLFGAHAALALKPDKEEASRLYSCEEKLCRQILDKSPSDGVLHCDLAKTWGGKDIDKGAKSKSMSWGFGDAQCSVELEMNRDRIIQALNAPKFELHVRPHQVLCKVETAKGVQPLKASLAPKIKFERGKAKKVWIRLKKIEGPEPLSSFVWSVAKLEDTLGIFHAEMIKQINKFIHRKCEQLYGEKAPAGKRHDEAANK